MQKNVHYVEVMVNLKTWYNFFKYSRYGSKTKTKCELSFGIYTALCTNCDSNYVGQTKTVSVTDGQLIKLVGIN